MSARSLRAWPLALAALLSAAPAGAQNIVANPGFETPVVPPANPNHILTFNAGSDVGGWMVSSGNIEILDKDRIQPAGGDQSIDMNGVAIGAIYQDLATVAGRRYDLSFMMAGNPFRSSDKTLDVYWGAAGGPLGLVGSFTFLWSPTQSAFDMQWSSRSATGLLATSASSRLVFQSTTPTTDAGAFLDDVSVVQVAAVPEPATVALLGGGLLALAGVARRVNRGRRA